MASKWIPMSWLPLSEWQAVISKWSLSDYTWPLLCHYPTIIHCTVIGANYLLHVHISDSSCNHRVLPNPRLTVKRLSQDGHRRSQMVQGGAGVNFVCTQCPSSFVHNPPLRKPESIICGVNPKHGGRSWGAGGWIAVRLTDNGRANRDRKVNSVLQTGKQTTDDKNLKASQSIKLLSNKWREL